LLELQFASPKKGLCIMQKKCLSLVLSKPMLCVKRVGRIVKWIWVVGHIVDQLR
jgi:hypothetical protein